MRNFAGKFVRASFYAFERVTICTSINAFSLLCATLSMPLYAAFINVQVRALVEIITRGFSLMYLLAHYTRASQLPSMLDVHVDYFF